jgi:UDP-N-acetyl-D-mannosaminuronic acid transferase (WecB/TagA/CpsF family)
MASVITAERIADLIEQAPGWALVGLTVPQERLRADARREVAEHVYSALYQSMDVEAGQLRLPL